MTPPLVHADLFFLFISFIIDSLRYGPPKTADQAVRAMFAGEFRSGYKVTLRFEDALYKMKKGAQWKSIVEKRKENIDLCFRTSESGHIDKDTVFLMDRNVLKWRTKMKFILRVGVRHEIVAPHQVTGEFMRSLRGKNFDLILRKRSEVKARGDALFSSRCETEMDFARPVGPAKRKVFEEVSNTSETIDEYPDVPRTPGHGLPEVEEFRERNRLSRPGISDCAVDGKKEVCNSTKKRKLGVGNRSEQTKKAETSATKISDSSSSSESSDSSSNSSSESSSSSDDEEGETKSVCKTADKSRTKNNK